MAKKPALAGNDGSASPEAQPARRRSGVYGRRAVMLGAAAAGAGVAASMTSGGVAEASSAVQLGQTNHGSSTTEIISTRSGAFDGQTSANGHSGVGGHDTSKGHTGNGVYGGSVNGKGVYGTSDHGTGVQGQTSEGGQSGVAGIDVSKHGGHGVYGRSEHGTGVYGDATGFNQSAVYGSNVSLNPGYGFYGVTLNGIGVYGQFGLGKAGETFASGVTGLDLSAAGEVGVAGQSTNGIGVYAAASDKGKALQVSGTAQFSMSGVVTVTKGHASLTVTAAGVRTTNLVLATIQTPEAGVYIEGAAPSSGSFRITLSKAVSADMQIGWLVLESPDG
jgi:hypothetical protein